MGRRRRLKEKKNNKKRKKKKVINRRERIKKLDSTVKKSFTEVGLEPGPIWWKAVTITIGLTGVLLT